MQTAALEAGKAQVIAYNKKDWNAAKAALTPDVIYDEVATQRKVQGVDKVLEVWKGWATAFPDSQGSFDNELISDGTVLLELTWRGTHKGPLRTPNGEIAPTGKKIELRACQICEVEGEKVKSVRQYFDMATLFRQLGVAPR
jgi:steroid delta-isomerase-like uncharacterized protein